MPKTIRDAVRITKELGHRYLWVDQYCISQRNDAHKDQQIRNIGKTYQGAALTNVAASSTSSHSGIAGISSDRETGLKTCEVDGRVVLKILRTEPIAYTHASPWWQRAWTLQEGFLSKRLLVFTDQEVSFYRKDCLDGVSLWSGAHREPPHHAVEKPKARLWALQTHRHQLIQRPRLHANRRTHGPAGVPTFGGTVHHTAYEF